MVENAEDRFSHVDSFIKAMVISVIQFCFAFFLLIILKFKTIV